MSIPTELDVLRDVVRRMESIGIDYMLTGSLAMIYYAEPRMTRDIDLVVALSQSEAEGFRAAFTGDYLLPDQLSRAIDRARFFNLIHRESVTKVDFVVRKETPYRLAEFERRRRVTVGDFALWIVSKEDLMLSKLDWARDSRSSVQLRDVRNLAATEYDHEYVDRWIATLGLEDVWEDATRE